MVSMALIATISANAKAAQLDVVDMNTEKPVVKYYENLGDEVISTRPYITFVDVECTTKRMPLNIRRSPAGDVIGSINSGEHALLLDENSDDSWEFIRYHISPNRYKVGWASKSYIAHNYE